jgi:hypothetical protein
MRDPREVFARRTLTTSSGQPPDLAYIAGLRAREAPRRTPFNESAFFRSVGFLSSHVCAGLAASPFRSELSERGYCRHGRKGR